MTTVRGGIIQTIDMDSKIYNALTKPDASWIYCQCGLRNFSTSFFESLDAGTFNTFESLGDPITASSPKINFRKSKRRRNQHAEELITPIFLTC